MNDSRIEQEIKAKGLNAPHVTKDMIDALMKRVSYFFVVPEGTTSTFAHAFLDQKFFLASGHSACVSPENFNEELGRSIAMDKANAASRDRLWEMEGYRLYASLHNDPQAKEESPMADGLIPVTDLNEFVAVLTDWHTTQVETVKHLMNVPEGVGVVIGDGADQQTKVLEGDFLEGYRLGIDLALNYMGTLPFVAEVEDEQPT